MLNLSDELSICSFFGIFVFVGRGNGTGIARSIWVKNPLHCILGTKPKPLAQRSTWACSIMIAEYIDIDSSLRGWRWGSVATLWQTLVSKKVHVVRSLSSLCRIVGKSLVGQIMVCWHAHVHDLQLHPLVIWTARMNGIWTYSLSAMKFIQVDR